MVQQVIPTVHGRKHNIGP